MFRKEKAKKCDIEIRKIIEGLVKEDKHLFQKDYDYLWPARSKCEREILKLTKEYENVKTHPDESEIRKRTKLRSLYNKIKRLQKKIGAIN